MARSTKEKEEARTTHAWADLRDIEESGGVELVQSSYSSVHAAPVTAESAVEWTDLDIIEGIKVPDSGHLEISYLALIKVEDFVEREAEDNIGALAIFLDSEQIIAGPGGSPIEQGINFNSEHWELLRTKCASVPALSVIPGSGADASPYGPFIGAERWSLAAEPGVRSIAVKAKLGAPEGGKVSVKDRRLVAITGSA